MINSNTSFGLLKEVIVGRDLVISNEISKSTFDICFVEEIGQAEYESPIEGYEIDYQKIILRNRELDDLANILEKKNIKVYRPTPLNKLINFKTPFFSSFVSPANNVRDISFIYRNKIVETPTYVRNRIFENMAMYDIFNEKFNNGDGCQWIKAPYTKLLDKSIDMYPLDYKRDWGNIPKHYEMAIDGAHFLRIGKDVIVNVRTYNHYLGYKWVESLFPDSKFHMISIETDHIDGTLVCLRPGLFLVDNKYRDTIKDIMPNKFKHWEYIFPDSNVLNTYKCQSDNIYDKILHKDRLSDINILSIDEHTAVVKNNAFATLNTLEKYNIDIIPVKLSHDEIFKGGIHCSTLDLVREDEFIGY